MSVRIITGDVREVLPTLPTDSFDCIVTSPPYFGLRDYGVSGQIGLEPTLGGYLAEMVGVCRELRRVLKPCGTFWLNIGDSYARNSGGYAPEGQRGKTSCISDRAKNAAIPSKRRALGDLKPKDLMLVPARLALALQADGWWVRSQIIWAKPNPMPESVSDRPTSSHETVWMLSKSERYFFDAGAVREEALWPDGPNAPQSIKSPYGQGFARSAKKRKRGVPPRHSQYASSDQSGLDQVNRGTGRNIRNVWNIATTPYPEAHFATFPPELAERCIKAGCPVGGHVLDPFGGVGTTGLVADRLQRNATLIELNPDYAAIARRRIDGDAPLFAEAAE